MGCVVRTISFALFPGKKKGMQYEQYNTISQQKQNKIEQEFAGAQTIFILD